MPVTRSSHSSCLRARESLTKKKMKRDSFASNENTAWLVSRTVPHPGTEQPGTTEDFDVLPRG